MNVNPNPAPGPASAGSAGARLREGLLAAVGALDDCGGFRAAAPAGLADEDVVAGLAAVEALGRLVDGLRVSYAAEIAYRGRHDLGNDGLTVRNNFSSPAAMIAAVTSVSMRTARGRVRLGEQVRVGESFLGQALPGKYDAVREALSDGRIGVDVADAIIRPLDDISGAALTDDVHAAAVRLVEQAGMSVGGFGFTADQIRGLAVRVRENIDPDGAEPRYTDLEEQRGLTFSRMRSGNTKMVAIFTPDQAAVWKAIDNAAFSPRVKPAFTTGDDTAEGNAEAGGAAAEGNAEAGGAAGEGNAETGDAAGEPEFLGGLETPEGQNVDTRTLSKRRVDFYTELARKSSGLPGMPVINGAAPTINIHATLEDIIAGRGVGWVDGIDEPIPASVVSQLLCHGDVITTLFGQHGHVLQHGKTRRYFTPAQNRALAARDGGCVWPGCDRPPSFCESHHVDEWKHDNHAPGRTDINNGALVCSFHHRHLHQSDWKLVMRFGVPHMIPPKWVDPDQTPRRCIQQTDRLNPPTPYRFDTKMRASGPPTRAGNAV
ncbi:HNH endonuclease signature motif containing protein [Subtercola lobariae]|uniref:HNH nuclease domain-containing protein n=1 Tax=Subtercola lobariae TaxID=1588641 RepID=A0A917B763_9MICO|nr:HNH endonuclease signature motif containing protein [Subtercola lobariae]GGF27290.1 hypothetical protein GCM10011399_20740 [Subtercola lobariae]